MSEHEVWLTITALNSAADKWEEWSKEIAWTYIADRFIEQAREARKLAERLAEVDHVELRADT